MVKLLLLFAMAFEPAYKHGAYTYTYNFISTSGSTVIQ